MSALTIGRVARTVVVACAVAAAAEPRTTLARQTIGTAQLHGRVVAADTGAAVRGATVTCSTSSGGVRQLTMTDDAGLFECRDLPTSVTTLRIVKAGFIETTIGLAVPLKEEQVSNRGDVRIVRGAVIAGRVLDASGEPMAEAIVNAWRIGYPQPGNRRIVPARTSVTTNDLGEYRLHSLASGTYYVSASTHRGLIVDASESMYFASTSPGSGVTFYPGTAYPSEAQTVSVQSGAQALGIDMRLLSERLASLAGRVVDSRGQAQANARVRLRSVPSVGFVTEVNAITDAAGRFTLVHPGPGEFRLGVTAPIESANVPVTFSAQPVTDLLIQTRPGNELRGRVLVDGAIPAPSPLGRFMMTMTPEGDSFLGAHSAATVAADGTFAIPGLIGKGRILALGAPVGTALVRVIANGLDVTDDGVDMDRGNVGGVEVHMTTRLTLVRGQVADATGKPSQGIVIVFSENPALWSKPSTRHVASRSAIPSGTFEFSGLPAGRYLAVVVEQTVPDQWADPENLLRLRPQATPFTVVEGELVTLSLRRK